MSVKSPPSIAQQKEVEAKFEDHRVKTAKNTHDINEILTKPDKISVKLIDKNNLIENKIRNREDHWQR